MAIKGLSLFRCMLLFYCPKPNIAMSFTNKNLLLNIMCTSYINISSLRSCISLSLHCYKPLFKTSNSENTCVYYMYTVRCSYSFFRYISETDPTKVYFSGTSRQPYLVSSVQWWIFISSVTLSLSLSVSILGLIHFGIKQIIFVAIKRIIYVPYYAFIRNN